MTAAEIIAPAVLDGWHELGGEKFEATISWPHDRPAGHMLSANAVRLGGILAAHLGYHVPTDHHVILERLSWQDSAAADTPADAVRVEVLCHNAVLRRGQLTALAYTVSACSSGTPRCRGEAELRFMSPGVYRFVRGTAARNDHVPGLVLLESALREAGMTAPGGPIEVDACFLRYAVRGKPWQVAASTEHGERGPVTVTVHQHDQDVLRAVVRRIP
ncbi:hypothetical protein [Actinophytocola oryzae]|uniref:A-factor biosynthesis hotdog protein n=1 Tax=Actinophytocola oryzae TaxID=502181 RepID=A0A4R7UW16_9PSEU|nr:hypothetical protein [Actinophytocola oryzae]TDV37785.1 A-factor biosynthesis hotdog protein [Actinophytocola oryzae]